MLVGRWDYFLKISFFSIWFHNKMQHVVNLLPLVFLAISPHLGDASKARLRGLKQVWNEISTPLFRTVGPKKELSISCKPERKLYHIQLLTSFETDSKLTFIVAKCGEGFCRSSHYRMQKRLIPSFFLPFCP